MHALGNLCKECLKPTKNLFSYLFGVFIAEIRLLHIYCRTLLLGTLSY